MSHYHVVQTVINEPLTCFLWFSVRINLDLGEFGQTLGFIAGPNTPEAKTPFVLMSSVSDVCHQQRNWNESWNYNHDFGFSLLSLTYLFDLACSSPTAMPDLQSECPSTPSESYFDWSGLQAPNIPARGLTFSNNNSKLLCMQQHHS